MAYRIRPSDIYTARLKVLPMVRLAPGLKRGSVNTDGGALFGSSRHTYSEEDAAGLSVTEGWRASRRRFPCAGQSSCCA